MIDSGIHTFEEMTKTVVADLAERKRLAAIGIRPLKRESKLSQAPVSNAIHGRPIKLRTLTIIRQAAARLSAKSWYELYRSAKETVPTSIATLAVASVF